MTTCTAETAGKTYFRSDPAHGVVGKVDREKNIIYGASLIQLGRLNEGDVRRHEVDEETLDEVVRLGRAPNKGIKARFTHPDMSNDGLGKFVGRWKNFRIDGDKTRADLHISNSSFNTPHGDLGNYVMDLAEEDPEAFANSIVFLPDRERMEESEDEEGFQRVRLTKLYAADVVDEPAATRGGFFSDSNFTTPAEFPYAANWLINVHFAGMSQGEIRTRVNSYLDKYFANHDIPVDDDIPVVDDTPVDEGEQLRKVSKMIASLRNKCVENGMDKDLSDDAAQQWLADNGATVFAVVAAPAPEDDGEGEDNEISELRATVQSLAKSVQELLDCVEDEDDDLDERHRCETIVAVCSKSGRPEIAKLAKKWISEGLSIEEVNRRLVDVLSASNASIPEDSADDLGEHQEEDDEDLPYRQEFRDANKKYPGRLHMTEDEYVAMRRIDDGKDVLRK